MRLLALLSALVLLTACNTSAGHSTLPPITPAGFATAPATPQRYTLKAVSGDGQSAHATLAFSTPLVQTSPTTWTRTPAPSTLLWLVVEVRDARGELADDVKIRFRGERFADGTVKGPIGLGDVMSGWPIGPVPGLSYTRAPEHGIAAAPCEPYVLGPQHATADVDPAWGTSNTLDFTVTGVP